MTYTEDKITRINIQYFDKASTYSFSFISWLTCKSQVPWLREDEDGRLSCENSSVSGLS